MILFIEMTCNCFQTIYKFETNGVYDLIEQTRNKLSNQIFLWQYINWFACFETTLNWFEVVSSISWFLRLNNIKTTEYNVIPSINTNLSFTNSLYLKHATMEPGCIHWELTTLFRTEIIKSISELCMLSAAVQTNL